VNNSAGRDHWPWVYSVAMAGGGTRAGTVYGASDGIAGHPALNPHDPRDLAATVYHLLGVPESTLVHDQTNRPHALIHGEDRWTADVKMATIQKKRTGRLRAAGGVIFWQVSVVHLILSNSTSKCSSALGGMTLPAPRSP